MRFNHFFTGLFAVVFVLTPPIAAQDPTAADPPPATERWNLFYQATSIGMYHGTFPSLHHGPLSLQNYPERDVSLTTTLFFGLNLGDHTQFYRSEEHTSELQSLTKLV